MWRRFNFFERHALEPSRELQGPAWACSAAGTGGASATPLLFFGGDDGALAAADARLKPQAGWRAHDARCTHLVFIQVRVQQRAWQPLMRRCASVKPLMRR